MGDLSEKVEQEQDSLREVVVRHGMGGHNERGDMWVDWCVTHEQVIMNTTGIYTHENSREWCEESYRLYHNQQVVRQLYPTDYIQPVKDYHG